MAVPGAPASVEITVGAGKITLTWEAATGDPTEYLVQRGNSAESLATVATCPATARNYSDQNLAAGTYFYAVRSKNAEGSSDPSTTLAADVLGTAIELSIGRFFAYAALVVGTLVLAYILVPFPNLPQTPTSLALVSGAVGGFLVRFGVILLIVAFIPAVMEGLARTFRVILPAVRPATPKNRQRDALDGPLATIVTGVVGQFPELLRRPSGYGITSILLGVILLIGGAFGYGDAGVGATPSPTPTPTASPASGPSTPTPSP